jgi:UDP-N-acetyl-D-mannosaminuronic acid dehydrogenase
MKISIVGGGGRVGLPLGVILSSLGNEIKIIDLNEEKNTLINNRIMPFNEPGIDLILKSLSKVQLIATSDESLIKDCEVCILVIGTPVLPDGKPTAESLVDLVQKMLPHFVNVKLLILRSTVYPGITQKISELFSRNKLSTKVAFCPERIAVGKALEELRNLPQIIGVADNDAYILATKVFEPLNSNFIRTSFEEAEITKLFANAYRYVNFAIANEFFEICIENNINWEKVWKALKQDYPRANALPSPGFAAGPCLVKDTQQLNYFNRGKFRLGISALEINENLPEYIVSVLKQKFKIEDLVIGILGMTFNKNIDDFRSSLSFKLRNILELEAKQVLCSDYILAKEYFVDTETLLQKADIIIISTPHSEYRHLEILKPTIDIWRISRSKSLI